MFTILMYFTMYKGVVRTLFGATDTLSYYSNKKYVITIHINLNKIKI